MDLYAQNFYTMGEIFHRAQQLEQQLWQKAFRKTLKAIESTIKEQSAATIIPKEDNAEQKYKEQKKGREKRTLSTWI